MIAAAKAFSRRASRRQGRLPHKITLDGYEASHRAAKAVLGELPRGQHSKIRFSEYLNNLIEQDHLSIKLRLGPMLGFKRIRRAAATIAGIKLIHRIRKDQFKLGRVGVKDKTRPKLEGSSRCMIRVKFQSACLPCLPEFAPQLSRASCRSDGERCAAVRRRRDSLLHLAKYFRILERRDLTCRKQQPRLFHLSRARRGGEDRAHLDPSA